MGGEAGTGRRERESNCKLTKQKGDGGIGEFGTGRYDCGEFSLGISGGKGGEACTSASPATASPTSGSSAADVSYVQIEYR